MREKACTVGEESYYKEKEKMQPTFQSFLIIACGGALGSIARYGVAALAQRIPVQLPIGTFAANLVGCFLIGLFTQLASGMSAVSPGMRLFLTAGFCGGFTTFSTFALEIITLADTGHPLQALVYAVSSVVLGLLALLVGVWIAKALL